MSNVSRSSRPRRLGRLILRHVFDAPRPLRPPQALLRRDAAEKPDAGRRAV